MVKGGKNDLEDNHNHNDIGSFIVVHNGRQTICDLGAPQYTASNFGKTRYEVINNSSLGHSVPIINGEGQFAGEGAYGRLTAGKKLTVDIKNAYQADMGKLERCFVLFENKIIMLDEFDYGADIRERFVSDIKPSLKGGLVKIDKTIFNIPEGWSVSVKEDKTTFHSGEPRKIYFIDLIPRNETDKFELTITFE